ncbi:SRPBCC domain-containing protein [Kitasatospora sp. NBC_00315]|uniref:SRPBCC domain-containing protein n=1 Tax=Kitasatospora sp. NBC_00315 TaxID=2975963 RepID=UPI00324787D5
MEHEVVVPMPAATVRQALQDPALLARCVPGLSTEPAAAGSGQAEEISGRLRLRIGTSTITYRGVLSLIEGREGVLTAFAEGQEARGSGEATATVRIAVTEGSTTPGEEHATVRFTADLTATGRLTEFDAEVLAAAGRRLLDRFAAALASEGADPGEEDEDGPDEEGADGPEATVLFLEDRAPTGEEAGPLGEGFEEAFGDDSLDDDLSDLIAFSDADAERFGLPTGNGSEEETGVPAGASGELPHDYDDEPVLSGPVRRSIVGRSAEEVDHAPPRGRYAPALPARSARARAASRWGGESGVSPLGAVAGGRPTVPWVIGGGVALLGGAVVLVRVLRRR